jgi:hypothetical protein
VRTGQALKPGILAGHQLKVNNCIRSFWLNQGTVTLIMQTFIGNPLRPNTVQWKMGKMVITSSGFGS